jgi:hypothetical protein
LLCKWLGVGAKLQHHVVLECCRLALVLIAVRSRCNLATQLVSMLLLPLPLLLLLLPLQDFVLAVHNRAAAAGPGGLTKRAEIMLELVVDIKNNRARDVKAGRTAAAAASGGSGKSSEVAAAQNVGGGRGGAAAVLQQGLLKWLKASGVDDITLANISWAKLVQPNKKGESVKGPYVSCLGFCTSFGQKPI